MTPEQYEQTQSTLITLSAIIKDLPLANFLDAITHAETVGAVLDPTLFHVASGKLQNVSRLARAFLRVQREIHRQLGIAEDQGWTSPPASSPSPTVNPP